MKLTGKNQCTLTLSNAYIEEQKWLELRRFFEANGGELLDAYELFDFPVTGRGVRAKRAVKKGERLVQGNPCHFCSPKSFQVDFRTRPERCHFESKNVFISLITGSVK